MTPELWTPRRRGAPRVECAPPFGFGLPFDMPPVTFGSIVFPTIAGLVARYRADLGTTVATGVSQWLDQSGSARTVTQATGSKQPTLNASDAAYNGQSTLSFVPANSQELDSGTWASISQPYSIFIVGNISGTLDQGLVGGTSSIVEVRGNSSGGATKNTLYAGSFLNSSVAADNLPTVFGCLFNGASSSVWVSAKTANATGAAGTNALADFQIGKDGAGNHFLNGKMAEICVYNVALTTGNISSLFDYFGNRYGITIGA